MQPWIFAGPDRLPRDLWGEIDRQQTLPFGTPQDVRLDVQRHISALGDDKGGVIGQLAWSPNDPIDTIVVAYEEWYKG